MKITSRNRAFITTGGTGKAKGAAMAKGKKSGKKPVLMVFDRDVTAKVIVDAMKTHLGKKKK